MSPWIPVVRGCRQGDPLSPYIFLLCAEVLSALVKKNNNIQGLSIDDKEYLIAQYADDTEFILDGSKEYFENAIETLDLFAKMSGLKINYDKSQVIWIGSKKKSC